MKKTKITVVGSINLDMVTTAERLPDQGETMMGQGFETAPGGKGANQAVAAARLGADVTLIGCVGDDPFGQLLLSNLKKEGVSVTGVEPVTDTSTGVATILVTDNDNRIIVTPGANNHVTPAYVQHYLSLINQSDIVVLQLEIPIETIQYVTAYCKAHNITVILNPAPIQALPQEILNNVTYVTPNETEAQALNIKQQQLITTLGAQGVKYDDDGKTVVIPGFSVNVVDTTGAGDTFNGALAVCLAEGKSLKQAIRFANAAAALSVQTFGAQGGMPTREAVNKLLSEGGNTK